MKTPESLPVTPPSLNYVHRATADQTRTAYRSDIQHFLQWGGVLPTDTGSIIRYCESYAESLKPSTLQRRIIALRQFHRYQGFADPTAHPLVEKTLRGIANTHGSPKKQAPALLLDSLSQLLAYLDTEKTLAACRDAALFSLGFFAALRAQELLKLERENVRFEDQGLLITLPRSKTDQSGEGQYCAIPKLDTQYCPFVLLDRWLRQAPLSSGLLFRAVTKSQKLQERSMSTQGFNHVLRHRAKQAGLRDAETLSSHSLRRGFATSASASGASFKSIMTQGRWRHEGTVLEYIEAGQRFNDNAASVLQR